MEGVLRQNTLNRWETVSPDGGSLFELTCGDVFEIETELGMNLTRIEAARGKYSTINEFPWREGLKARVDESRHRYRP